MRRMAALAAAALALLPTGASALPRQRADGEVYHVCEISYQVPVFAPEGPPILAQRDGARVVETPLPLSEGERFRASVEVNADGSLSSLSLSWHQAGTLYWPNSWRTDIHPLHLSASYWSLPQRNDRGDFDLDALWISFKLVSEQPLGGVWLVYFWPEDGPRGPIALAGQARIDESGDGMSAGIRWGLLSRYVDGSRRLEYRFSRPEGEPPNRRDGETFAEGTVDMAIIRSAVDELQRADARLREKVRAGVDWCQRRVWSAQEIDFDPAGQRLPLNPPETPAPSR